MSEEIILIGHGSGGRLSRELIEDIFVKNFSNPILENLGDAASIQINGSMLCFTTDSYVIDPVFFPGGNIGNLAVSGTVNDLCVTGAIPKYLSAGFIIEEGFSIKDLKKIAVSMAEEAKKARVAIVTGDTKVVKRGQCDKIYINTSGIGELPPDRGHISLGNTIAVGDKIIVSGTLGDHTIAVLAARENLSLDEQILSDTCPLNSLLETILGTPQDIRFMRDITRGGLATVINEICRSKKFGIDIEERDLPVHKSVRAVCELYGFDPMYLANEGKIFIIAKSGSEEYILEAIKKDPAGKNAKIVGQITDAHPGKAVMYSIIGGRRIIDMLSGEMLPRIC